MKELSTECAIAGGGPAGIMLGYLLARAGVDVIVLEKWPDFFRDFRGDTIHPATMNILNELGLLDKFLKLPLNETKEIAVNIGGKSAVVADFSKTGAIVPFLAFVPQWDFLTFIADEARKLPNFRLLMETEATGVIEEDGTVTGIRAKNKEEELTIKADLAVGADGRHSTIQQAAGFMPEEFGASVDVLWFRLSRKNIDKAQSLGYIGKRHMMVLLDRDDYWQCAFIIEKGGFERIKSDGLDELRKTVAATAPLLEESVHEIDSWDKVKLLSVAINRLKKWYKPGLLCIGDAAHAMSPVMGVGINLAIADAVAAANVLAPAFKKGAGIGEKDLTAVEERRLPPTMKMQRLQIFIHTHILDRVLAGSKEPSMPLPVRILDRIPYLRRFPARIVAFGFTPESVSALIRGK